ncbi:hypothetical protein RJ641_012839 [Dillenia turbinata]|uniref:RING-type domain-containing protein n=1 Tax=Dillenia turbinata TaxID=194707 RepID=A0AAN8V7V6_9MAGN
MRQKQSHNSSFRESIKTLEADIQHANTLAASLSRDYGGDCVQMRLSYSPIAPLFLFLMEWMDYRCTDTIPSYLGLLNILIYKVYADGMPTMSSGERKATLKEFYAIIYPSLRQLEGDLTELKDNHRRGRCSEVMSRKRSEERRKLQEKDVDRDDECGICMESWSNVVLPNCGHSMCLGCFHDWNVRSQSCPFCRGNLKRVTSRDLWILTSNNDVVDTSVIAGDNLRRFYLYIDNLPLLMPDTHVFVYDYML